jgi:Na+-translocating ferredoxin:NAD+ oxidoreductase subunit A
LRTIAFIMVIASLVQFVEMFLKKSIPALYAGLGIFLPLITTNCAVMGVCLLNVQDELSFLKRLLLLRHMPQVSAWRLFFSPGFANAST